MADWLRGRRVLWLGLTALVALILVMPLRIALDAAGLGTRGLTARSVVGSLWYGGLIDARFGAVSLGSLRAGLSPLPLFVGQTRVWVSSDAGTSPVPLQGALISGLGGQGIVGMSGDVPVGEVLTPLPITSIRLDEASVRFLGGVCAAASGNVTAKLASAIDAVPGLALPKALSGPARCEAGKLVLPLVSQSGTEALTLRLGGDGRYQAQLALQTSDAALTDKLRLAGFIEGPRGWQLSIEGRL